jgi:hypothetical protein
LPHGLAARKKGRWQAFFYGVHDKFKSRDLFGRKIKKNKKTKKPKTKNKKTATVRRMRAANDESECGRPRPKRPPAQKGIGASGEHEGPGARGILLQAAPTGEAILKGGRRVD